MVMMTLDDSLQVTRIPGDCGPILRCAGELTFDTMEILRQELALLEPLGHSALLLNLNDCRYLDTHGVLTVLTSFRRLRGKGQRLVVVAQAGFAAQLLHRVGFDRVVPTFPDEETAMLALRGGPPQDTPRSWEEARQRTVGYWQLLREAVENAPPLETLRLLTSMNPLCQRSDELFRLSDASPWNRPAGSPPEEASENNSSARCDFCPLFHRLGEGSEEIGCQSLIAPIIAAVQAGDRHQASNLVAETIRTLEAMPLSELDPPTDADR
jgi:anti-anti-sigma factor